MTNEQKELLKAMHLIKNYCESTDNCHECCLSHDHSIEGCPFIDVPSEGWNLKPLEEEKDFSVFK